MAVAETANLFVNLSLGGNFNSGISKAERSLSGFHASLGRSSKGVGELAGGLAKAGAVIATGLAVGLGAAARSFITFEDAFAGVRKTVGGSKKELDDLALGLRGLALRIPVNVNDLAAIAQEAGALGVARKDIVSFTEDVARLSAATTGLTTDAAAEAIGKLGNILNIHGKTVSNFASSLVALGNAGASSEADIIETAKRFGAAGSAAKLSAADVLGFSSAIASLGVEPEAAGSSLSRLFNKITLDIGTGNAKLHEFAKTAGLTDASFTKLFKKNSTEGLLAFLTGLGKLDRFQVANVLKKAGITNIRDINAVLLLSQHVGLLKDQLKISNVAFKENTALAEASDARFTTLKNKLILFKQSLNEAGIVLAEGFGPALGRVADKLASFLKDPGNKDQIRKLGDEIGQALDRVDFKGILDKAGQFVGVLKGALTVAEKMFEIFSALPTQIQAATVGFLALNKLSGGLIAKGLGDIVGGLTSGLASKVPGVGKLFAQPVYVVNFPPGFGLGGGGGGLPGAAGAAGGAGAIGLIGAVVPIAAALATTYIATSAFADKNTALASMGLTPQQIADTKFGASDAFGQQSAIKHGFGPTGTSRGGLATRTASDLSEAASQLRNSAIDEHRSAGSLREAASQIRNASNRSFTFARAGAAHNAAINSQEAASQLRNVGFAPSLVVKPAPVTTNVNVNVSVTASGIHKTVTVQRRYGPAGGSAIVGAAGHTPGGV